MSEHFWGSYKAFEILANLGLDPLSIVNKPALTTEKLGDCIMVGDEGFRLPVVCAIYRLSLRSSASSKADVLVPPEP
jgi:hypothetical protein